MQGTTSRRTGQYIARCGALLLAIAIVGLAGGAEITKGPLAPGKNVPGTFHPYNVNARVPVKTEPEPEGTPKKKKRAEYTTKGKFHCLVTEYDLDPVVMLVARGLDDNAAFRDLLQKLDGAIDRNPAVRLRCFVVFLFDDLANVVTEDDKRTEYAEKVGKVVDDLKLRHVVLTIAGKNDLARYGLDDSVPLTAILYKNLRIINSWAVPKDQLDKSGSADLKALLADVSGKLKATR